MPRPQTLSVVVAMLALLLLSACLSGPTLTPTARPFTITPAPTATPPAISSRTAPYLTEVARFGKGIPETAAWSPNEMILAVGGSAGVYLYDATTFDTIGLLETEVWVQALAYSPDGALLAAGGRDGTAQIWDAASHELLHSLKGHPGEVAALAFSPDGTKLAAGGSTTISLWNPLTGDLVDRYPGQPRYIRDLAFSPDGQSLISATYDDVRVRELSSGHLRYPPLQPDNGVDDLTISPDGRSILTVSTDARSDSDSVIHYPGGLLAWDLRTGKLLDTLSIDAPLWSTAISPDGRWLVSGGSEDGIHIWDRVDGKEAAVLLDYTGAVTSLAFSPSGKQLFAIGRDAKVVIWDFQGRNVLKVIDDYAGGMYAAAVSPDGHWIATDSWHGVLRIWDASTGQLVHTLPGAGPLAFSPDSRLLAAANGDRASASLYHTDTWDTLPFQIRHSDSSGGIRLNTIAFSPDGQTIATGGGGNNAEVTLWSVESGALLHTLSSERYDTESLGFSPDGDTLVVGASPVEFWDTRTGARLNAPDPNIMAGIDIVTYSSDGSLLLLASGTGGEVLIWDVKRNAIRATVDIGTEYAKAVSLSADGSFLVVYDANSPSIRLVDAETGSLLYSIPVRGAWIAGAAFVKDGRALVTISDDGLIRWWQVGSAPVATLVPLPSRTPNLAPAVSPTPLHLTVPIIASLGKGAAEASAWSPDRQTIAIGGPGGIRLYDGVSLQELRFIPLPYVASITFSPDGSLMGAAVNSDIQVVDVRTGRTLATAPAGAGFSKLTFSSDNTRFAFIVSFCFGMGLDCNSWIGVWDIARNALLYSFASPENTRFSDLAISPDGKTLAAGNMDDHQVYVWDLVSGESRFALQGHASHISSVVFSPDGRLATGSYDASVRLWDPATGQLVRVMTGFTSSVTGVRFSEDGRALYVDTSSGPAQVRDVRTGQPLGTLPASPDPDPANPIRLAEGYMDRIEQVLFSPDGASLMVSSSKPHPTLWLWDLPSRALKSAVQAEPLPVLGYSDGRVLAAADQDGKLVISDALTGAPIRTLAGAKTGELTFSPDGQFLAGTEGNQIQLWRLRDGKLLHLLEARGDEVTALSFDSDGNTLVSVADPGLIVQRWDLAAGTVLGEFDAPEGADTWRNILVHDHTLASFNGGLSGYRIELWDIVTGRRTQVLWGLRDWQVDMAFSPDGRLLAVDDYYGLTIWDTATGQALYTYDEETHGVALAFSPDGRTLAVEKDYGLLELWDVGQVAEAAALLPASEPQVQPTLIPTPTSTPLPPLPAVTQQVKPALDAHAISPETLADLRQLQRIGKGKIGQAGWALDGKTLYVASARGVTLYDAATLAESGHLATDVPMTDLVFLPGSRVMAGGSGGGKVQVWDVTHEELLLAVPGAGRVALSPDGRMAAFIAGDGNLQVWDLNARKPIATLMDYSDFYAGFLSFSPDSRHVLASLFDGSVRIWDAASGSVAGALGGPSDSVLGIAFSPDGRTLAGGTQDGQVWVWDQRTNEPLHTFTIFEPPPYPDELTASGRRRLPGLAFSPDGKTLAVGAADGQIRLLDSKGEVLKTFSTFTSPVERLAFSRDGKLLLAWDIDAVLRVWDLETGAVTHTFTGYASRFSGLQFQSDGTLAAWGGSSFWKMDPTTGSVLHITNIGNGSIFAASHDGRHLAVYHSSNIGLWDAVTGTLLQTLEGEPYEWEIMRQVYEGFNSAQFSPDDRWLAAVGSGGLWIWRREDGRLVQQVELQVPELATAMAFSPDGRLSAVNSQAYYNLSVLDTMSGELLRQFGGSGNNQEIYVGKVAFSPNGRWLATTSLVGGTHPISIWNLGNGQRVITLSAGDAVPASLAFSPDGRLLAVGTDAGQVGLWTTTDFTQATTIEAHTGGVLYLAFSVDGRWLASANEDGTISVWGTDSR